MGQKFFFTQEINVVFFRSISICLTIKSLCAIVIIFNLETDDFYIKLFKENLTQIENRKKKIINYTFKKCYSWNTIFTLL